MNPRKDWSWRPDATTRKMLDEGGKKIRAAQKRRGVELKKSKAKAPA